MHRDDLVARIRAGEMITHVSLVGVDLSGADLSGGIFEEVNLVGANLFRADLLDVVVDGATVMKDAYLTQIRFIAPKKRDHAPG